MLVVLITRLMSVTFWFHIYTWAYAKFTAWPVSVAGKSWLSSNLREFADSDIVQYLALPVRFSFNDSTHIAVQPYIFQRMSMISDLQYVRRDEWWTTMLQQLNWAGSRLQAAWLEWKRTGQTVKISPYMFHIFLYILFTSNPDPVCFMIRDLP